MHYLNSRTRLDQYNNVEEFEKASMVKQQIDLALANTELKLSEIAILENKINEFIKED